MTVSGGERRLVQHNPNSPICSQCSLQQQVHPRQQEFSYSLSYYLPLEKKYLMESISFEACCNFSIKEVACFSSSRILSLSAYEHFLFDMMMPPQ